MLPLQPSFTEFQRLARRGNVVPVFRAIVADLLSPVSAFLNVASPYEKDSKAASHSFLLESVEGGERVGRYPFF